MVPTNAGACRDRRPIYGAWLVSSLVAIISLFVAGLYASSLFRSVDILPADRSLRIEPQAIHIEDREFGEGEMVRGRFRIINDDDRPLMIDAIQTSCSCLASVTDDHRKPPFPLAPKSSVEITLTTTALSLRGSDQRYSIIVAGSADGQQLPERIAGMTFRVADSLKVDPPSLNILEAPAGKAIERGIRLYTYRDTAIRAEPTIRVRGSAQIRASLRKPLEQEAMDSPTPTHFVVDVRVEPDPDSGPIAGEIEIDTSGQPPISIPVTCSFQQEFRLQPTEIHISGRPGATLERDVFQEFRAERWRHLEIVSRPAGTEVTIHPFDSKTNRIHIKATLPEKGTDPLLDRPIVLAPGDHSRMLTVPVHFSYEE